jgi:hypothetical protein
MRWAAPSARSWRPIGRTSTWMMSQHTEDLTHDEPSRRAGEFFASVR